MRWCSSKPSRFQYSMETAAFVCLRVCLPTSLHHISTNVSNEVSPTRTEISLGDVALSKVLIPLLGEGSGPRVSLSHPPTAVGVQINRQIILNAVHCGSVAEILDETHTTQLLFLTVSHRNKWCVRFRDRGCDRKREKKIIRPAIICVTAGADQ